MSVRLPTALLRLLGSLALGVALVAPVSAQTTRVYDNSTTDTFITYVFSVGGYSQIGDLVTLSGTDRFLSDVSVQFFNSVKEGGTFDAELRLYAAGSPDFSLLGTYSVTGITIGDFSPATVSFTGLGVTVPDQLAFAVSVSNFGDLDLGLNAFEPPTVGSSNASEILVNSGSGLAIGNAGAGEGNLYFVANAVTVPEPSTTALVAAGLLLLTYGARRRRDA